MQPSDLTTAYKDILKCHDTIDNISVLTIRKSNTVVFFFSFLILHHLLLTSPTSSKQHSLIAGMCLGINHTNKIMSTFSSKSSRSR